MADPAIIGTIIAGVIGTILGAGGITPLIIHLLKAKRDLSTDARDYASATFARMEARIVKIEIAEEECREAKEAMAIELGEMRSTNASMKRELDELRKIIEAYDKTERIAAHVVCDSEGKIIRWYGAAEKLFGWAEDEALGKNVDILVPPYAHEKHRKMLNIAAASPEPLVNRVVPNAFAQHKMPSRPMVPVEITLNSFVVEGKKFFEAELRATA
jgi:PAS domain-containing protein